MENKDLTAGKQEAIFILKNENKSCWNREIIKNI
jgi:hypothetical protein